MNDITITPEVVREAWINKLTNNCESCLNCPFSIEKNPFNLYCWVVTGLTKGNVYFQEGNKKRLLELTPDLYEIYIEKLIRNCLENGEYITYKDIYNVIFEVSDIKKYPPICRDAIFGDKQDCSKCKCYDCWDEKYE